MITLEALPDAVVASMRSHVAAAYPREACGVVFRTGSGYEAFAGRNVARDQAHAFRISTRDLVQISLRLKTGDALVAIYHSHIDTPACFSIEDRRFAAAYPEALHLVFAVTARGVLAVHGFRADGTPVDAPVEVPA